MKIGARRPAEMVGQQDKRKLHEKSKTRRNRNKDRIRNKKNKSKNETNQ